jgi:hypothetical protein
MTSKVTSKKGCYLPAYMRIPCKEGEYDYQNWEHFYGDEQGRLREPYVQ